MILPFQNTTKHVMSSTAAHKKKIRETKVTSFSRKKVKKRRLNNARKQSPVDTNRIILDIGHKQKALFDSHHTEEDDGWLAGQKARSELV